ncbi:HU family DNA-binding protein [Dongshaea marina]|uniref:HU family DNA-binding protein n=1 Tax=Dongshaea marina TaxID=2047966 RepID=UPI000D3ED763|nr:HU family DNA-binding protein [Dongshaea marina]
MNKKQLIAAIAAKSEVNQTQAKAVLDAALSSIESALALGERVELPGFGAFEVRERSAREGRNPQTGESIQIAAAKVPAFKPGKSLKDAVNG